MATMRVEDIQPGMGFVLVDVDTGAVMGTNVRLVHFTTTMEESLNSREETIAYADSIGVSLSFDTEDFGLRAQRALTAEPLAVPDTI